MRDAELPPEENRWDLVFDFTETNEDGEKENHFKTLDSSQFSIVTKQVEGFEDVEPSCLPVPESYSANLSDFTGGTFTDNDPNQRQQHDGMMEFGFDTNLEEAQKAFDQQNEPQAEQAEPSMDEPAIGEDEPYVENQLQNDDGGLGDWGADFGQSDQNDQVQDSFNQDSIHPQTNESGFISAHGDPFGSQQPDDGLDDDEREHLRQVQLEQEERMRSLAQKQSEELKEKEERRQAARRALDEWYSKRDAQVEQKKKDNKEAEWAYLKMIEEHKTSKNPWEKIIDSCEMNKSKYSGSADVSRLRQAMLARKGDLKRLATEEKK